MRFRIATPRVKIAAAGFLLAASATEASAQLNQAPGGAYGRWSGNQGNVQLDWDVPLGYAISGLETAESFDKPCRFGVLYKGLPGTPDEYRNRDPNYGQQQINLQCSANFSDLIPSRKRAGFFQPNRRYVIGARVCVKSNNGRVKGIRVFAGRAANSGAVENVNDTRTFTRPNCQEWRRPSNCPANKVATGVQVGFNQSGIVGVRLRCSALETT